MGKPRRLEGSTLPIQVYKTNCLIPLGAMCLFSTLRGFLFWLNRRRILMKMKTTKECITLESLSDILEPKHIALYLGISRRRVYELCHLSPKHGGIPNFSIGASIRVDKEDFKQWIEQKKKARIQNWPR